VTPLLQGRHRTLFIDSFLTCEPEDAPCKKACDRKVAVTHLLQGRHRTFFIDSFLTCEPEDAPCKKACDRKGPETPLVRESSGPTCYLELSYKAQSHSFSYKKSWLVARATKIMH